MLFKGSLICLILPSLSRVLLVMLLSGSVMMVGVVFAPPLPQLAQPPDVL